MSAYSDHTMDWHRRHGSFYVLYPDGQRSQPFTYDVACDYRQIFGGEVIRMTPTPNVSPATPCLRPESYWPYVVGCVVVVAFIVFYFILHPSAPFMTQ